MNYSATELFSPLYVVPANGLNKKLLAICNVEFSDLTTYETQALLVHAMKMCQTATVIIR